MKQFRVSVPTATYVINAENENEAFRKYKILLEECDVLIEQVPEKEAQKNLKQGMGLDVKLEESAFTQLEVFKLKQLTCEHEFKPYVGYQCSCCGQRNQACGECSKEFEHKCNDHTEDGYCLNCR